MESRWRYATGVLALPCIIGGINVLDTHPIWAYTLFVAGGISIIWGIWPLLTHKATIVNNIKQETKLVNKTYFSREDAQEIYEKVNELLRQLVKVAPQIRADNKSSYPIDPFFQDIRYLNIKDDIDKVMEKCYDKELDNRLGALIHSVIKLLEHNLVPQDISLELDKGHRLIREHIAKIKRC
jgi:hypothetical protein